MAAVTHDRYDDAYLRKILRETRTIAMVGLSANWNRPSYFAAKYLLDRGYKVMPVNPVAAGQEILGQKVYGALAELPVKADMVDIFRNSEVAAKVVDASSGTVYTSASSAAAITDMVQKVMAVPPSDPHSAALVQALTDHYNAAIAAKATTP